MARRHDPSRRYHDRVAHQYDRIYDDPYWALHDELTWRAIKPHLPRDASAECLDLGCGTGKWGLRLLKSGYATTFVDHAPQMVEQARLKIGEAGLRIERAALVVGDIVDLGMLESGRYSLAVAMGDPLSICSDPPRAAREMHRLLKPGGIVIATADNRLAALEHYAQRGDLDGLEALVRTGRTRWLTADRDERFDLHTFTPLGLRKLFEKAGFEVIDLIGKTILPVRKNERLLAAPGAVERLLRLEGELGRDPAAAACAGHLQVTARRPA